MSVRARVTAVATLVLAVALVVAGVVANRLLHRALLSDIDASLAHRLDEVTALTVEGELTAVLVPTGQDLAQLQVLDASGRLIATTPGLADTVRLDIIEAPVPGREVRTTVDGSRLGGKAGDDYRLVARTVAVGSQPFTIYAVTSLATAVRAQSHLRLGLAVGLPLVVALGGWLIWWVTGRALAPVDAMRAEVDQIQATDLSRRVQPAGGESEIGRLGATLNRMLDRLGDAADRQQLFAASASHELRSPLSAIRTELEVGLAYPDRADWPKIAGDSLVEVDRLEALARDLRTLTRPVPPPDTDRRCDLWAVITDEVGRRRPARGVRYAIQGSSTVVAVDEATVAQVVRNLFDNAERHATTGIAVAVTDAGAGAGRNSGSGSGRVTLSVANDGPPIPADRHEQIFEPFTRLDEARSLDAGGTGLGLAIARSVLHAVGGTLVAADVDHGAQFLATFPAPTPPAG